MARGLVAFRWLALGWAAVGVVVQRDHVERWWLAAVLLGAAAVVSVLATSDASSRPLTAGSPLLFVEVGVAAALLLLETHVFDAGRDQSLAWAWPAAGIIAVALAAGVVWGMLTAAALSAASIFGESLLKGELQWDTSTASKAALLILAALTAAAVADVLRTAAREISTVRAREEMARVLHDGVLQTLAVIQRRSTDDALRALAQDQERDLRSYLFGSSPAAVELAAGLRQTAAAVERRHELTIGVVVAADLPDRPDDVVEAICGAVGEALTNAAKHSSADRISLFAEPDDDDAIEVNVNDNGRGFDPDLVETGEGLARSIRARIEELGGTVTVDSAPGRGTDVRLWVP